jgi:hypothetical protein
VEKKTVMIITNSMLDCKCKGNGYIFLKEGGMIKCPTHYACASSEEYRLEMLRLEYQNLREFVLQMPNMKSSFIDLSLPTTAKGVDEHIKANYNVVSPASWVRGIQHYVREYLLNYEVNEDS